MKLNNCTSGVLLTLIAGLCLAAGCEHDPQPAQRPTDVSANAVWVRGKDVGAYFDCSSGNPSNRFNECTVWNDTDGSVRLHGRFLLKDLDRPATANELVYKAADGSTITLDQGLVLHKAN